MVTAVAALAIFIHTFYSDKKMVSKKVMIEIDHYFDELESVQWVRSAAE